MEIRCFYYISRLPRDPETMCLIFLIVINAVNGAMDGEVTPATIRKSHWTNFAICTAGGGQDHGGLHLLTTLHSARLPNLHKIFNKCDQLIVAIRTSVSGAQFWMCVVKDYFFQYAQVPTPALNLYDASSNCFSTAKG